MSKLNKIQKSVMMLLLVFIVICSQVVSVSAAEDDDYTYTIRLFPGQQGHFADGSEYIEITDRNYGDTVILSPDEENVILNDGSKYYIKGVRESGKDNNTVLLASSFIVTGDRDYVVAYGLRASMVSYVVNYVDTAGNTLMPSDVYYGNVGDKPVVAYLYINGYLPQAYNLTRTLVENAAENVFTFVYTPVSGIEYPTTVTTTILPGTYSSIVEVIPGTITRTTLPTTTRTGETQVLDGRGNGNGNNNGAGEDADTADDQDTADLEEVEDIQVPQDLIDLDDQDVPLSNKTVSIGPVEADARILFSVIVLLIAVLVIAGASWWYWGYRRKKSKEEEAEEENAEEEENDEE